MEPLKNHTISSEQGSASPNPQTGGLLEPIAKVLIVEDDEHIAQLLHYNCKKQGFLSLIAYDGLEALNIVERECPSIILLDILLPKLDGFEVCRLIRTHQHVHIASTPIILISALTSPDDKEKGLGLGANAYLPKPFSVREVFQVAKRLLGLNGGGDII